MPENKKLFLSIVSNEFASYCRLLADDLKRPSLDVAVQEDFINTGGSTLEKLDDYIRSCHGVIHIIGNATGAMPPEAAVKDVLARYPDLATTLPPLAGPLGNAQPGFSYTQWEAYLALYHRRELFVYRPTDFDQSLLQVPRGESFVFSASEDRSQRAHYRRICDLGHDRGEFLNEERLSSAVLRDLVEILPRLETAKRVDISRIIKYAPVELIGRDAEMKMLADAWLQATAEAKGRPHVLTFVALGGEGKTSLVAKWAADLAAQDWPGCDAVFAWSFYSQGTREQTAVSSDLFLAEALTFFGDAAMAGSAQGAFDKGRRLAQLVGERRALLILDGLEPLQYAPTSPTPGELKDQGLAALLKGLAATSHGLCFVTTRYALPDLRAFHGTTVREEKLTRLSRDAGVHLLKSLGVRGSEIRNRPLRAGDETSDKVNEFEKLVEDVKGHALTLNLLGSYLRDAHGGDIRRRDLVKLEEANSEEQGGHAFHVMDAYVRTFETSGKTEEDTAKGHRALALLRLLGLFDRPASADCLTALLAAPAIPGLTEPLFSTQKKWLGLQQTVDPISAERLNVTLTRLESARLVTVNRDASGTLLSLDAHPLLREYFAQRLRAQQPDAWRAAHRRVYEHLCATTKEGEQPTLEDLQPLYQAVAHGCQAGLQQEAGAKVYVARIKRRDENYSSRKLGAFGSDLGAVACFFETPWSRVSLALAEGTQAWLLNEAAFRLRALGRLTEALEPMRVSGEMDVKVEQWKGAAISYSNLSELELTLGEVAGAVADAEQSVTYADRSGDSGMRMIMRTTHASALHEAGRRAEAEARFREAEQMQTDLQPAFPLLYSLRGFQYCDQLLAAAERTAGKFEGRTKEEECLTVCRDVSQRATQALRIAERNNWLLDIALDHLSLGRAALYAAVLSSDSAALASFLLPTSHVQQAVSDLRRAGQQQYLPLGLLTRAWCFVAEASKRKPLSNETRTQASMKSAQSDLDEAWDIAARGLMPLFMADIHLYRARLFGMSNHVVRALNEGGTTTYPWQSPQHDLAEARRLIFKHGYLRRKEELEDAEAALLAR
jgi:tetratricopeptide (TPR) repeat protein